VSSLEDELGRALDAGAPVAGAGTLDAIVARHHSERARRLQRVTAVSVVVAVASVAVAASGVARPAARPAAAALAPGPKRAGARVPSATAAALAPGPKRAAARVPSATARPGGSSGRSAAVTGGTARGEVAPEHLAFSAPGSTSVRAGAVPACGAGPCGTAALRLLFVRRHAGVTVRAYTVGPVAGVGVCPVRTALVAEVSDARAVGVVGGSVPVPAHPGERALDVSAARVVGVREGAPVVVVVVRAGSPVRSVSARFGGGALDAMRPVGGWAVLVDEAVSSAAHAVAGLPVALSATIGSGRVVASTRVARVPLVAAPAACAGRGSVIAPGR